MSGSLDYFVSEDVKEFELDNKTFKPVEDIQKPSKKMKVLAVLDTLVKNFKISNVYAG